MGMLCSIGYAKCLESHTTDGAVFVKDGMYRGEVIPEEKAALFDFVRLIFMGTEKVKRYVGSNCVVCPCPRTRFIVPTEEAHKLLQDFPNWFTLLSEHRLVSLEADGADTWWTEEEVVTAFSPDRELVFVLPASKLPQNASWLSHAKKSVSAISRYVDRLFVSVLGIPDVQVNQFQQWLRGKSYANIVPYACSSELENVEFLMQHCIAPYLAIADVSTDGRRYRGIRRDFDSGVSYEELFRKHNVLFLDIADASAKDALHELLHSE